MVIVSKGDPEKLICRNCFFLLLRWRVRIYKPVESSLICCESKITAIPMPNFSFGNITSLHILCTAPFSDNIHGRTCHSSLFCALNEKWDYTKHRDIHVFSAKPKALQHMWQVSIQQFSLTREFPQPSLPRRASIYKEKMKQKRLVLMCTPPGLMLLAI